MPVKHQAVTTIRVAVVKLMISLAMTRIQKKHNNSLVNRKDLMNEKTVRFTINNRSKKEPKLHKVASLSIS